MEDKSIPHGWVKQDQDWGNQGGTARSTQLGVQDQGGGGQYGAEVIEHYLILQLYNHNFLNKYWNLFSLCQFSGRVKNKE